MRNWLDNIYRTAEQIAMALLFIIASLVILQVAGRVLDAILGLVGIRPIGLHVPSLAEIAGFLLVGASFLALAGSFRSGSHIRVTLLITSLPSAMRRGLEILVLSIGLALTAYFCWYCVKLVFDSYRFNELSYGIIAIPIWIPQATMTAGIAVFAVALADDLASAVTGRQPSYQAAEDAAAETAEGI